jgi:orotate phosphoribosyltransferase
MSICNQLVKPFAGEGINTVAAPATGGIILAAGMVRSFEWKGPLTGREIKCVWADKEGDDFVFNRAGFTDHLDGQKVLVVEDLLTTGGSVLKVCRKVEEHGGHVVGVSAVCNRGGVTAKDLEVPKLQSIMSVDFTAVDADDCSLCADQVPIVEDIGHGHAYRQSHPDYRGGYVTLLS